MTLFIAIFILLIMSINLSIVFKKRVEDILPLTFFSIPIILLPFYCLNILIIGKYLIYFVVILNVIYVIYQTKKHKINFVFELKKKLTPSILLFFILFIIYFMFLKNNLIGLWDELRLWGAVPKALFYTNELQLGSDSFIFSSMQSYLPGMPLLIYFLTSFTKVFNEYYLFIVYAILVLLILLPSLKNLNWKKWPLFIPIISLIILLPCIFTSPGSDGDFFYLSLFIDSVLGIVIGYVFYLATKNPFTSFFKTIQFCIISSFAIILKDSAISFVLFAIITAFLINLIDCKTNNNKLNKKYLLVSLSIFIPYFIWKITLISYNVINHIEFNNLIPTTKVVIGFFEHLITKPMFIIGLGSYAIKLPFLHCFLIMIVVFIIMNIKIKNLNRKTSLICFLSMILSTLFFIIGYLSLFGKYYNEVDGFMSFQRYFSTILFIFLIFIVLYILPFIIETFKLEKINYKKIVGKLKFLVILLANILIIFVVYIYLEKWESKKNIGEVYNVSLLHSENIKNNINGSEDNLQDVYLLISENPLDNSLLHHRIYYNLLDTSIRIKNFYNDTNIILNCNDFNFKESKDIKKYAKKWKEKLLEEDYEYVYIISINESIISVFKELNSDTIPKEKNLYKIVKENKNIKFKLIK